MNTYGPTDTSRAWDEVGRNGGERVWGEVDVPEKKKFFCAPLGRCNQSAAAAAPPEIVNSTVRERGVRSPAAAVASGSGSGARFDSVIVTIALCS